jgi:hypothetical protein
LLNSLTIFLPLNSLSGREKEHIPLDNNNISIFFSDFLIFHIYF